MGAVDKGARGDTRSRRQFQRTAIGEDVTYGDGLIFDVDDQQLSLALATPGQGLTFLSGGLAIDLADTNPGLEFSGGELQVDVDDTTIQRGSNGLEAVAPEGLWTVTSVQTGSYTASWGELVRVDPSGGGFTVTLPAAGSSAGRAILVKNVTTSTNAVVIDGNASETIDGAASFTMNRPRNAFLFISDGTNVMVA